jgi:dihydropteroate synthase
LKYGKRSISKLGKTRCGKTEFRWGDRTYVMGIINLSPDSFSGDGLADVESAVAQAHNMVKEGVDILDVGGESTRPGASPISAEEEIRRVIPAIKQIASRIEVPISIDSYKYEVVCQALDAGASLINDQWGLKKEARLAELAAERKVPLILMNNLRDQEKLDPDIMVDVLAVLRQSLEKALRYQVPWENLIVDPGIGFVKDWGNNIEIIRRLDELKVLQRPILLGPSRKSFIKMILDLPPDERVEGTAAAVAIGIAKGADMVRVHDVRPMVRVCKVSDAIIRRKE